MNIRTTHPVMLVLALAFSSNGRAANEASAFSELKLNLTTNAKFEAGELEWRCKKMSSDLRIKCWEALYSMYFGQAKVDNKWEIGMVYKYGKTRMG